MFEATPGTKKGGALLSVGTGPLPLPTPHHHKATNRKTGGYHPKNWKGAGIFFLGGDALGLVAGTTLASILNCMACLYYPSSSCIIASRFLSSRLHSFFCVSRPRRCGTTMVLSLLMDNLLHGMCPNGQILLGRFSGKAPHHLAIDESYARLGERQGSSSISFSSVIQLQ